MIFACMICSRQIIFVIYANCSIFSIVFVAAPIVFNSVLAFSILMTELSKNTKFQEWFGQNVRIVSVLTLLAGADVEVITILGSKFAGWQMFSAPLSKTALNYVFWGSTLNLFIEDVPQLVIQVCENNWFNKMILSF